jgi:hypothetical protein
VQIELLHLSIRRVRAGALLEAARQWASDQALGRWTWEEFLAERLT